MSKLIASMTAALIFLAGLSSFFPREKSCGDFCFFSFFTTAPAAEFAEENENDSRVVVCNQDQEVEFKFKFIEVLFSFLSY